MVWKVLWLGPLWLARLLGLWAALSFGRRLTSSYSSSPWPSRPAWPPGPLLFSLVPRRAPYKTAAISLVAPKTQCFPGFGLNALRGTTGHLVIYAFLIKATMRPKAPKRTLKASKMRPKLFGVHALGSFYPIGFAVVSG